MRGYNKKGGEIKYTQPAVAAFIVFAAIKSIFYVVLS